MRPLNSFFAIGWIY
uniref:Uncharacterized protein n=1 Tax=Arundo donax TaxID=35708 RepID=A0A0A9E0E9_ARUDO